MPVNRHLEFAEIRDFTPGLWTVDDWQMPPSAATQMDDCRPDVGGGLRAAPKAQTFTVTGLPTGAGIRAIGAYIVGGQGPLAADSDRYIWLLNGTNVQVWFRSDTVGGAWAQIGSNIAIGAGTINTVIADYFVDAAAAEYVLFNIFQTAANDGLYSINRPANTVTLRLAGPTTSLVVQDDRILSAQGEEIRFSDSQSVSSFPAANSLLVQASRQGRNIVAMRAFAPSDILCGLQFAPWVSIQGDITDPVVRSMSDARPATGIQLLPMTASGMAFTSARKGIFLTGDGSSFTNISEQIDPNTWTQLDLAYSENYLLSGAGLVWHEETKSWYNPSAITGSCRVAGTTIHDELMSVDYVANAPVIHRWKTDASAPSNTWTWKSAPFRKEDGRQLEIREVQAFVRTHDANATLTCTVSGVTFQMQSTLADSTGQMVSFLGIARGEKLDITLVSTAGNAANEAPSIEVLRVGQGKGHQTY